MQGTNEELHAALNNAPEIDRTTLNSWEDPDFRAAIEATGRKKLIVAGLCYLIITLPLTYLVRRMEAQQRKATR